MWQRWWDVGWGLGERTYTGHTPNDGSVNGAIRRVGSGKGDGAGGGLNVKTVFVGYIYCISGVFLVFLQNEKIKITEYGYSRD